MNKPTFETTQCTFESDKWREELGEIIGEASMCWKEIPTGVFDSDRAVKLIDRLESLLSEERNKAKEELMSERSNGWKSDIRNEVLEEVKKEVERHRMSGAEFGGGRIMVEYSEISTLLEKLKVK